MDLVPRHKEETIAGLDDAGKARAEAAVCGVEAKRANGRRETPGPFFHQQTDRTLSPMAKFLELHFSYRQSLRITNGCAACLQRRHRPFFFPTTNSPNDNIVALSLTPSTPFNVLIFLRIG
jgi:hypothetical protein